MNATELLAELHSRGVVLEAAGERLRYDAPKGALTPELRAALAEHKAELLELVDPRVRTQATDLVAVAELLVAGQMLGWRELRVAPHLTILAGQEHWNRFLQFPPPGMLEAALKVAKRRVEEAWPL